MGQIANRNCKCALLTLAVMLFVIPETALGQTTAFSYQGRLTDANHAADGFFDMQFKLFNTPDVGTGTQQGPDVTNSAVQVTKGVFSLMLDFGNVFDGTARSLEISLRPTGSLDPRTVLSPRQRITSSPYAIQTVNTQQLGGLPASWYVAAEPSGNVGIGITSSTVQTPTNNYGLIHTDRTVSFGSFVGGASAPAGGWFGTKSNHPLYFFTNNSGSAVVIDTNGSVAIGCNAGSAVYKFGVNCST